MPPLRGEGGGRGAGGRMGGAYLQGCLALLHQALDQVVLGFCEQLLDLPTALGQGDRPVPQVVEYRTEVLPAAVDEDPACRGGRRQGGLVTRAPLSRKAPRRTGGAPVSPPRGEGFTQSHQQRAGQACAALSGPSDPVAGNHHTPDSSGLRLLDATAPRGPKHVSEVPSQIPGTRPSRERPRPPLLRKMHANDPNNRTRPLEEIYPPLFLQDVFRL